MGVMAEIYVPALLLLMVGYFAGVVAWAYAPSRRRQMNEDALIPLRDD